MTAPATIERLARETVEITDPVTALRALTALRRELDATEPEIVQRALHAGASWSQIARALGVTKQAAHRKYRHLFDQAWGETPGAPRMTISNEARRSVQFAREEANRLGQPAVGTEHILLGILRCEDSLAARALNAEGVTLEAARNCLQTTMPGIPLSALERPADGNAVSTHARRIIEGARREASRRGESRVGVEHLLLALLADSRSGAVQTLEQCRASPARVERRLEHASEDTPAPALTQAAQGGQLTSRSRPLSTS
jgi:ATP-dependent Clp protease ATP-binding subunit ClpA